MMTTSDESINQHDSIGTASPNLSSRPSTVPVPPKGGVGSVDGDSSPHSSTSKSRRRYIVNGRIVQQRPWRFGTTAATFSACFDLRKCFCILFLVVVLWVTNPTNHLLSSTTTTTNDLHIYWMTNYGFFSIEEKSNEIIFHMSTFQLSCPFTNFIYEDITIDRAYICRTIRNSMTHQKPIIYDPKDRVYTTHRIYIWTLVGTAFLTYCQKQNPHSTRTSTTGSIILDSIGVTFIRNPYEPFMGLMWCIIEANAILYPIWNIMNTVILKQRKDSIYHFFGPNQMDWNYLLSVLSIIWTAIFINAFIKQWTGYYLLRSRTIIAVAIGYYRGLSLLSTNEFHLFNHGSNTIDQSSSWMTMSTQNMTWLLILFEATFYSLPCAILYFVANLIGYHIGHYQHLHLMIHFPIQKIFDNLWEMIFGHGIF